MRERLHRQGIKPNAQNINLNSFRPGTRMQCKTYLQKWHAYAVQHNKDPFRPHVSDILDFLTFLFEGGLGYSGMTTARAALSSAIELADSPCTVSSHPLVNRFHKGVFNARPSLPRYNSTWDVSIVLNYLNSLPDYNSISLKLLTMKTNMLCLLVTGCRGQTLSKLNLTDMEITDNSFKFFINSLIKQSRPGKHQPVVELKAFTTNPAICVVRCMQAYLERTEVLRNNTTQLFISYNKPHKPVTIATISRWARGTMSAAGINTQLFKPHSTRAASSSAAFKSATPLSTILMTAGWSSDCTFAKYYKKEIVKPNDYGHNVLSCVTSVDLDVDNVC